jgi:predicted nucleic acid-binding protein
MADLVIADTSALIVLTNSGHLPLILAKESGLIISLRQAIDDLMATGFRLSPVLIAEVLDKFEP